MLPSIRTCLFALGLGIGPSLLLGCSVDVWGSMDESAQGIDSSADSPIDAKGMDSSEKEIGVDASMEAEVSADVSLDASDSGDLCVDGDTSLEADSAEEADVTIEADTSVDTIQVDTSQDTNADSTALDCAVDSPDGAESSSDSGGDSDAAADTALDAPVDAPSDGLIDSGPCVLGANYCDMDCDGAQTSNCGGNDCCDSDSRAFPGQTAFFGEARKCGGFDFSCDGKETKRWTSKGQACKYCAIPWCCVDDGDYTDEPPACGVAGRVAHCSDGFTCKNGDEQRTQECN